ncbi:MAG: Rieske 2Fe-2S domain-containing protein [Acidimicrobiia bacterium]|nr:Rieske 2Fe-2S domain-containing protein [Actinomycetota bacterium]MBL6925033.1 Rieske 2Fe-2S domain-containing protein [Acidimicrobiia bacterium]MBL6926876.1 Rieske 2Fe-2S domain-containing protein [Acidimicrobiia bacterium]
MVVVIPIIVLVVMAGVILIGASRRRERNAAGLSREARRNDRTNPVLDAGSSDAPPTGRQVEQEAVAARQVEAAPVVESAPAEPFVAPDPQALGVSRRQFFNRSIVGMMGLGLSGFGGACIAFLWPQGVSGFGSKLKVGNMVELLAEIKDKNGFLYRPEGRMWITAYPNGAVEKARAAYSSTELAGMAAGVENGFESGVVALYQKCPHLGCRVPECVSSQWFECPCHGSQFNQVGEKRGGPAPRGMDRFAMSVVDGVLTVDTGTIVQGPPIGTNTTGQEAEGPHCIGAGGGH